MTQLVQSDYSVHWILMEAVMFKTPLDSCYEFYYAYHQGNIIEKEGQLII